MSVLGKFKKQPGETLDYDISYVEFFSNRYDDIADTETGIVVTADDPSITVGLMVDGELVSHTRIDKAVQIILSDGTMDKKYKITIVMTTTTGIIKEDEFFVTLKET